MSPSRHFLLCTTPRTGSSSLCAMLAETGIAGMQPHPTLGAEYLLELLTPGWPGLQGPSLDLGAQLRSAFRRSATANGVAGFKTMWGQWPPLMAQVKHANPGTFYNRSGFFYFLPEGTRFVWLVREDTIAQAVSLAKAMQTQCWDSDSQRSFAGLQVFDYLGIAKFRWMIGRHNEQWREFFEEHGIEPLKITYESFSADRPATVRAILDFVGVDHASTEIREESFFHPQRDAVSERWKRRFTEIDARGRLGKGVLAFDLLARRLLAARLTSVRSRARIRRLAAETRLAEAR